MEEVLSLAEYRIKNALVIQEKLDVYTLVGSLVLDMYYEYLCICGVDKDVLKEIKYLINGITNKIDRTENEEAINQVIILYSLK